MKTFDRYHGIVHQTDELKTTLIPGERRSIEQMVKLMEILNFNSHHCGVTYFIKLEDGQEKGEPLS